MRLIDDFFSRYRVDFPALLPFGFRLEEEKYRYDFEIMNGAFAVSFFVDKKGKLSEKIIEKDLEEEFFGVNAEGYNGYFINSLREEYKKELGRIREKCFMKVPFKNDQSNRITRFIAEKYGETPDFPFKKSEGYGVFRYKENRKWYGLIMNLKGSLVDESLGEEEVEIINLKIDPKERETLLNKKGVYPGYHMNRENWISIVLDGSVEDKEVERLLDVSRGYAMGKPKSAVSGVRYWLQPANPAYYDIEKAFENAEVILWKQSRKVRVGDICYMYLAAPVSAVRYKCEIVEADIPYSYSDENLSITHVMKIKKLATLNVPVGFLRSIGIKFIRGPVPLGKETAEKIEKANKT